MGCGDETLPKLIHQYIQTTGYCRLMDKISDGNGTACGIPIACERIVPAWLIALDNIPTAVMFLLGSALIWKISPVFSLLFLVYCGLSIVLFWRLICPWCHHFESSGCPCGYGRIAPRFFQRRAGKEFRKVFRRNIGVVFPCWIAPLVAGLYLLRTQFSGTVLILFLSFCVVGFVLIPAISKFVGCRHCTIKADCPWMS
jgi:hypothetical protein